MIIKRIDADTVRIYEYIDVKISELEKQRDELAAIDASAKTHDAWVATIPAEKQEFVHTMPETAAEVAVLQKRIDDYKKLKVENAEVV